MRSKPLFNPSTPRQRQVALCVFKATLVYTVSFWPDPHSKTLPQKGNNKRQTFKNTLKGGQRGGEQTRVLPALPEVCFPAPKAPIPGSTQPLVLQLESYNSRLASERTALTHKSTKAKIVTHFSNSNI